jgi:hypothetical protein
MVARCASADTDEARDLAVEIWNACASAGLKPERSKILKMGSVFGVHVSGSSEPARILSQALESFRIDVRVRPRTNEAGAPLLDVHVGQKP